MKKLLIALLLAALTVTMVVPAVASAASEPRRPVNPYQQEAYNLPTPSVFNDLKTYLASGGLDITLKSTTGDYYNGGRTWTFEATGGSGSYDYQYQLANREDPRFGNGRVHVQKRFDTGNTNVFTYEFLVPGDYILWFYVKDGTGTQVSHYTLFTVESDGHKTTEQYAQDVVAECRAAGCTSDYDTALWLHDWLTSHMYYDETYTYYSADAALIRGTGVCDAYSKAYYLMLEAAGIPVDRMLSVSHAWNIVKLDGKWYQIDPTWDDPAIGVEEAVSGAESHDYFCLPDEVMQRVPSHALEAGFTPVASCTSYDYHYFIRNGRADEWIQEIQDQVYDPLSESRLTFDIDLSQMQFKESDEAQYLADSLVSMAVLAYVIRQNDWALTDGVVHVGMSYNIGDDTIPAWVVLEGIAQLPADLVELEDESFMNATGFMTAELYDGVETIGARAFAGCNWLWQIIIPGSVTSIDASAFDGCPHLNIVCPAGSYAEQFAQQHNINCVAQ